LADKKISQLTNLTGANLAENDEFVLVDTSADETKAITFGELKTAFDTGTGFVRVTGDTMTGDLAFGDNDKAIFGAGSDLQIYHDGSNSYIDDQGTGRIIIKGNDDVRIRSGANEEMIVASSNGAVTLYHDSFPKLATTSTGVDVTGTVTSDGLTVSTTSAVTASFSRDGTDGDALQIFNGAVGSTKSLGLGVSGTHGTINSQYGGVYIQPSGVTSAFFGTGGDISFYEDTGTTPKFFWDASAEALGIGTSSPTSFTPSTLVVEAATTAGITISDSTGGGTASIAFSATGAFQNRAKINCTMSSQSLEFSTAGSERMRITSAGSVGIGTSLPVAVLDVKGSIGAAEGVVYVTDTSGTGASSYPVVSLRDTSGQRGLVGMLGDFMHLNASAASTGMIFKTSNTERMRIDSIGNLLVGVTSGLLNERIRADFAAGNTGITTSVGSTAQQSHIAFFNGSVVGSISTNGSATAYNTSSDYRLKEDVQPMVGASDRVLALKPVNFAWKADGSRTDGFLAHEAQAVAPEAVAGEKDAVDADGNPQYQGIDQSKLVPLLTAALQEALTEIADLKARVATLEA